MRSGELRDELVNLVESKAELAQELAAARDRGERRVRQDIASNDLREKERRALDAVMAERRRAWMALRPYQREAVDAVFGELRSHRSTLVCLPTGCGKTIVFAEVARRWRRETGQRVLVLAHREELILQAVDKIQRTTDLVCDVEMAEREASSLALSDVVVGTVQTLKSPKRHGKFGPKGFGLIIVDEAHHATARSYRDVLEYFAGAKVLGVTATPDRSDQVGLGNVFQSAAYVYEVRQAIDDGWLVPIRQRTVECDGLDLSSVRVTGGDLSASDLERLLERDETLHQVASPLVDLAGQRQTIVFLPGVAQAHRLAETIKGYQRTAVALDGSSERAARQHWLTEYQSGRLQFLVNCALFTEGFDAPATSCIAIARPTKSRSLYAQMIGRGTRLAPAKSDCLVLDFVGNAGRHQLATVGDVLDGRELDAEVQAEVKKRTSTGMPVHEAVDEAFRVVEDRRARLKVAAQYRTREVSLFDVLGIQPTDYKFHCELTDKQRDYLARQGFEAKQLESMDKRTASKAIDTLIERSKKHAATLKQGKILARYGLPTDVPFKQASEWIDSIAKNGWKLPSNLISKVAA